MDPETPATLAEAERHLGYKLPDDYKELMLTHGPMKEVFPNEYVELYDIATVLEVKALRASFEPSAGLVVIGTDGSVELFVYDMRRDAPPIVAVNIVSPGWPAAFFQASNFNDFWHQVTTEGLQFVARYE
jgi:hypothetical protein